MTINLYYPGIIVIIRLLNMCLLSFYYVRSRVLDPHIASVDRRDRTTALCLSLCDCECPVHSK